MPFVGYLIIFNTTLAELFATILPSALTTESETQGLLSLLYSRNLYFLYFGLLLFGSGVAIFNAAAPSQIRRFPALEDYIASMESIKTPSLVGVSFEDVIGIYFAGPKEDRRIQRRMDFPRDLNGALHRFIHEVCTKFIESKPMYSFSDQNELFSQFRSGSGNLLTDEILEVAYSGRTVDKVIRQVLLDEAIELSKDVFYLEHRALEYSRSFLRFMVSFFYCVGLVLLVVPTLVTSAMILTFW